MRKVSLLQMIQEKQAQYAEEKAKDTRRIDAITLPELTIDDEKLFAMFERVPENLHVTGSNTRAEVSLTRDFTNMEEIPRDIVQWVEACAQLYQSLKTGWNFRPTDNFKQAEKIFWASYDQRLQQFCRYLKSKWDEFDSSISPVHVNYHHRYDRLMYQTPNGELRWSGARLWGERPRYEAVNLVPRCNKVPQFTLTFDWGPPPGPGPTDVDSCSCCSDNNDAEAEESEQKKARVESSQ